MPAATAFGRFRPRVARVYGTLALDIEAPIGLFALTRQGSKRGRSNMPSPEELIREVAPVWRWGGRGPITDPIDMVFKLPDQVQGQVTVVRLETAAALYRALAEGFGKAAQIIGGAQSRG
jgi:hypothetical protein